VSRCRPMRGWTQRVRRGKNALCPIAQYPHAVRSEDCRAFAGRERLPTDLCRALGGVQTRLSALRDPLRRWACGQDARVRPSRPEGLYRVSLSTWWPREASGLHELQVVSVLTMRQSLCRQLGRSGQQETAGGGDLSSHCPHRARGVKDHLLSERPSVAESLHAMWGALSG